MAARRGRLAHEENPGEEVAVEKVKKSEKRLGEDDLVAYALQNGTFRIGKIPKQDALGRHRSKAKCHDLTAEDLGSDPLYRNIFVNLYPNDDQPSDLLPKDLVILDRNFCIGQLVKKGNRVGYVSGFTQTASAKIYEPDSAKRNDEHHELYLFNKPAAFFEDPSPATYNNGVLPRTTLEKGDAVTMRGWIGHIKTISRFVTISVNFRNRLSHQTAHGNQLDLLVMMIKGHVTQIGVLPTSICHFEINGLNGIFTGRTFHIEYKYIEDAVNNASSFRWTAPDIPKPTDKSTLVEVTVTSVKLHSVIVEWEKRIDPVGNAAKPPVNIKNTTDREQLIVVSHPKPMKVGDIRICSMTRPEWTTVMGKFSWISCLCKEYFLHKRRDKRPRMDEDITEILPLHPPNKKVAVEIMTTNTKVDVLWLDGDETNSKGIDARELDPVRYKKHFPGAIIHSSLVRGQYHDFNALGNGLNRLITYSVVQSSNMVTLNFRDRSTWNIQDYTLNIGAVEPVLTGEPRLVRAYTRPLRQFNFWEKNHPQVVTKMRNSTAVFSFGCVIGMFPDGRVRIKNEEGEIMSVWPTDLVPVRQDIPSRYIFDIVTF